MPKQDLFVVNKDKVKIFFVTAVVLFSISFFFFDPSFSPFGRAIQSLVIYGSIFLLLILDGFKLKLTLPFFVLFSYLFILNYSRVGDLSAFSYSNLIFSGTNILLFLAITYKRFKGEIFLRSFDIIVYLFVLLNIFSLIFYISIFLNIYTPYDLINLGGRGYFYRDYFNLAIFTDYTIYPFGPYVIPRLGGMFEEPGMLGTFSGILLAFDILFFPKKITRKVILSIYGILSLSMAFYIFAAFIGLYLLRKHFKKVMIYVLLFSVLAVLFTPPPIKEAVQVTILNRFTIGENGWLEGDNRYSIYADQFNTYFNNANTYQILFGNGIGSNNNEGAHFATYQGYIYEAGILGFFLMFIFLSYFLLYLPFKYKRKDILLLTILPILSIYQGRQSVDFLTLLICFCLVYILRNQMQREISPKTILQNGIG